MSSVLPFGSRRTTRARLPAAYFVRPLVCHEDIQHTQSVTIRNRLRFRCLADDFDLLIKRANEILHNHGDLWVLHVFGQPMPDVVGQLRRRQPGRLDVLDKRDRNLTVRPHRHGILAQLRGLIDEHPQFIACAYDIGPPFIRSGCDGRWLHSLGRHCARRENEACEQYANMAQGPTKHANMILHIEARPSSTLVGAEGVEPPPLLCKSSALPLSYAPARARAIGRYRSRLLTSRLLRLQPKIVAEAPKLHSWTGWWSRKDFLDPARNWANFPVHSFGTTHVPQRVVILRPRSHHALLD